MAAPTMPISSQPTHSNPHVRHQTTNGRKHKTSSEENQPKTKSSEDSSSNNNPRLVTVGQPLPSSIMNTSLRAQDNNPTTLQTLLDQNTDGIIITVFSKKSKKQFLSEFQTLAPGPMHPNIHLTSIGISKYSVSINASIMKEAEEYLPEGEYHLLSDPRCRALEGMGFVRVPARSKTWVTRLRCEGRVRCGFFVVRKDGTLYVKKMGPLGNVVEGIALAVRQLHKEWVLELRKLGKVVPPW